jgi:sugar lactone lactonase YvrE
MQLFRFVFFAVALTVGVAACGGGASNSATPITIGAAANTTSSTTFAVTTQAETHVLPSLGGFSSSVSLQAVSAPAGTTMTVTGSLTAPQGFKLTQSAERQPQDGTLEVFFYQTFTPSQTITLSGQPGLTITLPVSVDPTGRQFFYALSDPTQTGVAAFFNVRGPAIVSGHTVTFAPSASPITLVGGQQYVLAFYATTGLPGPTPSPAALYIGNSGGPSITVYAPGADGDVAPIRTIEGGATGLSPNDLALDATGNVYVVNAGDGITVFAPRAGGNVAPIRNISGDLTRLQLPQSIALDAAGNIYVTNIAGHSPGSDGNVLVYAPGANGNVAPIRNITGALTELLSSNLPEGLTVDALGTTYASTGSTGNQILVYAAGTNGNVAPTRRIAGSQTGLKAPAGMALDANGNLYVANHDGDSVTVYPPQANGNAAPMRTISGDQTKLAFPIHVALDAIGTVYVTNIRPGSYSVTIFAPGANGNVAPVRTISGDRTGLQAPEGIALGPP